MGNLKLSSLAFFAVIIFVFQLLLATPMAQAEGDSNFHITLWGGQRNMSSEDDWTLQLIDGTLDFSKQTVFGIEGDYGKNDWAANILLGFSSSKSEGDILVNNGFAWVPVKVEASTSEFYVGARKYFNSGQTVRPYINGAISFITPEVKFAGPAGSISIDESETGGLFGGGAVFQFGHLLLILDGRILVGTDISNYSQFGLALGFAF